jgi:hypothetical protein
MRDVLRRVGNAGETVSVVISVGSRVSVLVGYRGAAAARIVRKGGERGPIRICDLLQAIAQIIIEGRQPVGRVQDGCAVAAQIVRVRGDVVLFILNRVDQPGGD